MTRKDYQAAVELLNIRNQKTDTPIFHQTEAKAIAFFLCEFFEGDNPRFDRERFMAACKPATGEYP